MPTQPYFSERFPKRRLPGVTTVISSNLGWGKDALMYWAWNEGIEGRDYGETKRRAADIGTVAHCLIECDILSKKFDWSLPDVVNIPEQSRDEFFKKASTCLKNFRSWKSMVNFRVVATEIPLVSEKYLYGGCLDMVASINDEICLFDWKSSRKSGFSSYVIQTAAYINLWNENNDIKMNKVYILRIDKDDPESWEIKYIGGEEKIKIAFSVFLHLLSIHYSKYSLEGKKHIFEDWMLFKEE